MTQWLITPHRPSDLESIVALVNSAYRGDSAEVGWTHESDYVDGQRTSLADLQGELAAEPAPKLLVVRQEAGGEIIACVMIERLVDADGGVAGYIGMLTVHPARQADGLGRMVLAAAEDQARADGAMRARMTVVSIRDTLIAWYERRGYRLTGETRPFPYEDGRFGAPRVPDLKFVVLEKPLTDASE
ncbi:MAG TPA: GNAT family N-acetyltransferase [Caulobacteraceae bacterium]|jgi:ribosomal protein S18 acetylase RimI-like enzyme|nr:GNAT family N-acetyltransferase [Caulobacteraceae bacterium]